MTGKDAAINDLLERLDLQGRGWISVDHWEADTCAIGIAHRDEPRRLIYISTFQKRPGRYDYECEAPSPTDADDYDTVAKQVDADFNEVLRAAEEHLA